MSLGVYISVPFCRTKCSYCNFASDVFSRTLFDRYVDRVCADIRDAPATASAMGGALEPEADTIYLGGGTPTLLDSLQLERIFKAVRGQFSIAPDAEVTVECAPGTLTPQVIKTLASCGVNRVSLGVQSFVDAEAAAVGRLHKRSAVLDDIAHLRAAGINNLNIDLIAGLPHQTAASWRVSLNETIATGVPHVSVYMLEVDEDSRLGRELIAGGTRFHAHFVPEEDASADFYLEACEKLESSGISQYEISNFAGGGFQSQHNLKYWTRQPYLGFGVDAHSMLPVASKEVAPREEHDFRMFPSTSTDAANREGHDFSRAGTGPDEDAGFSHSGGRVEAIRFATPDSLHRYTSGEAPQKSAVSRHAALEESFFLGLRLTRGVSLSELTGKFGESAVSHFAAAIAEMIESGLIEKLSDNIRLTERGMLLSNEVFQKFLAPIGVLG